MTRQELLKKLDALLAKAETERMFGAIEIIIRGGRATVISKTETDRLDQHDNGGISHARSYHR